MNIAALSRSKTLFLVGLTMSSVMPVVAYAQATASSVSGDGLDAVNIHAKTDGPTFQTEAKARLAQGPLASDPRLDVKVTLHKQRATVADVLEALSKTTHVELTTTGAELPYAPLFIFTDAKPLRDVLDGMAHLRDWEWVRRQDKTLELHQRPRFDRWDGVRPNTEAQAEQYRQGRQFLSQLSYCPPAVRNALTDPHQSGVAFSSLPPEMQKAVESMLIAGSPSLTALSHTSVPAPEDSTVRLQMEGRQEWGNEYLVDVFDGHTGVGLNFPMFNDPDENTDQVVPVSSLPVTQWYASARDAASRKEIAKDDARLKRLQVPVTLDLQDVPLTVCLRTLGAATGLSFAADLSSDRTTDKGSSAVRKSVTVSQKPLMDTLDRLAALYVQTWSQTESGMIVFHPAPEQPAPNKPVPNKPATGVAAKS